MAAEVREYYSYLLGEVEIPPGPIVLPEGLTPTILAKIIYQTLVKKATMLEEVRQIQILYSAWAILNDAYTPVSVTSKGSQSGGVSAAYDVGARTRRSTATQVNTDTRCAGAQTERQRRSGGPQAGVVSQTPPATRRDESTQTTRRVSSFTAHAGSQTVRAEGSRTAASQTVRAEGSRTTSSQTVRAEGSLTVARASQTVAAGGHGVTAGSQTLIAGVKLVASGSQTAPGGGRLLAVGSQTEGGVAVLPGRPTSAGTQTMVRGDSAAATQTVWRPRWRLGRVVGAPRPPPVRSAFSSGVEDKGFPRRFHGHRLLRKSDAEPRPVPLTAAAVGADPRPVSARGAAGDGAQSCRDSHSDSDTGAPLDPRPRGVEPRRRSTSASSTCGPELAARLGHPSSPEGAADDSVTSADGTVLLQLSSVVAVDSRGSYLLHQPPELKLTAGGDRGPSDMELESDPN